MRRVLCFFLPFLFLNSPLQLRILSEDRRHPPPHHQVSLCIHRFVLLHIRPPRHPDALICTGIILKSKHNVLGAGSKMFQASMLHW